MVSILVVGAGGVGLVFASIVSKHSDVVVSVYARSNYAAILENNVSIDRTDDPSKSTTFVPQAVYNAETAKTYTGPKFDYVVIASKSLGTEALSGLEPFIDNNKTIMFLFQNGINIEQPYLKAYPNVAIAPTVVKVACALTAPSVVSWYSSFLTAEYGLVSKITEPFTSSLDAFTKLCTDVEIKVTLSNNIVKARWEKLLWNGTFNTLCAILNIPVGGLFDAGLDSLTKQLMTEIWTVASKAVGEEWYPESYIEETFRFTKERVPRDFLPSTLQDVRRGTPIEYEAIVGNCITAAQEYNVEVPTIKAIYNLLKGVNYRISQPE